MIHGGGWWAAWLMMLITAAGLSLRLVNITVLPTGFHGDEAIVGMESLRVLRDGYIGVYSTSALGQPTGPFYLSAILVWLFGETVLAVRLLAVILGTLTIPALYVVVRRFIDIPTALLAATFLAVMGWHIHYSRIAFPLPSWPLWVVLTAGVLTQAVTSGRLVWWAAAGGMAGLGAYTYNGHTLALGVLGLIALIMLLRERTLDRHVLTRGGAFTAALTVALLPMAWYVVNHTDTYLAHFEQASIRSSPAWQAHDGPLERARYAIGAYGDFWRELCCDPRFDNVDATGITATVSFPLLALAVVGMILGMLRYRSPLVYTGITLVLLMPISTVLTIDGEQRRTLIMAPFLALFAALAVVELFKAGRNARGRLAMPLIVAAVSLVAVTGVVIDLRNYFFVHAESPVQRWVFAEPIADASHYMGTLSGDRYVYFYADRWSIDYETRQFLAPDIDGEDCSREFGDFSLDIDRERGRPVFILIGDYLTLLDEVMERYPDGEIVYGGSEAAPTFIAYELPARD